MLLLRSIFHFLRYWDLLSSRRREQPLRRFLSMMRNSGSRLALLRIYSKTYLETKISTGTLKTLLVWSSESSKECMSSYSGSTLDFDLRVAKAPGYFFFRSDFLVSFLRLGLWVKDSLESPSLSPPFLLAARPRLLALRGCICKNNKFEPLYYKCY